MLIDADVLRSTWRTWGAAGLARRGGYELQKRSGALRGRERRWPDAPPTGARVARIGLGDARRATRDRWEPPAVTGDGIRLYGGVELDLPAPPDWHRHPLTGHQFDAAAHWSMLRDDDPGQGDIKDVWELSRLGWLHRDLRRWAATGDDDVAARIWATVVDWYRRNPPYRGPNWMCGQEASLRTISVLVLADALDPSDATTDHHRDVVASLVHDAVGRVWPTLGYAQSQRNNHATSEAGFLWGASVLAPWVPDASRLRDRAGRALAEAARDQFAPDGGYSQHSPTYARVALHVLLWCDAIARATGETLPDEVREALGRAHGHLSALLVPGSEGLMPNLGGNDGALVFDLAPGGVRDFRPLLAHLAAALGCASVAGPGPWDEEAAWFGLEATDGTAPAVPAPSVATHALTRGGTHAVLRAGPLSHRPAHADQLHVDLWIDGQPVATDAGSYRYTAPEPWGNALAGEEVHNLPSRPSSPQARRSGRFFWRTWREADVLERLEGTAWVGRSARLELPDGTVVRRALVVAEGVVVVVDRADAEVVVRWNLPATAEVVVGAERVAVAGEGWAASVLGGGAATVLEPSPDLPSSGWQALTYGVLTPVRPLLVGSGPEGVVVSAFTVDRLSHRLPSLVAAAGAIDLDRFDRDAVEALLTDE